MARTDSPPTETPIAVALPDGRTVAFAPLGTNTICALETALHLVFGEIVSALGVDGLGRWSLTVTRHVLHAAHVAATPVERDRLSLEEIGVLIDALGFDGIGPIVNDLILPARVRAVTSTVTGRPDAGGGFA